METKLLFAVDIGNTNITVGLFKNAEVVKSWNLNTDVQKTSDEYAFLLHGFIVYAGFRIDQIFNAVMCSVVPSITHTIYTALWKLLGRKPTVINAGKRTSIKVIYDRSQDVGVDRVMDALAVKSMYGCPAIVVDVGTATVFNAVTSKGEYIGGAISPGIKASLDALYTSTSMLRRVDLEPPETIIGRNTVASMQSGIMYGFVCLIEGMVNRFKEEMEHLNLGKEPKVIATGGMVSFIAGLVSCFDLVDTELTLHGLRIAYALNIP